MYETVRTVKGYGIKRMKGTHGFYHVTIRKGVEVNFRTIKAAVEYIERNL